MQAVYRCVAFNGPEAVAVECVARDAYVPTEYEHCFQGNNNKNMTCFTFVLKLNKLK